MSTVLKCSAITLKGKQCCFNAKNNSVFCGKHINNTTEIKDLTSVETKISQPVENKSTTKNLIVTIDNDFVDGMLVDLKNDTEDLLNKIENKINIDEIKSLTSEKQQELLNKYIYSTLTFTYESLDIIIHDLKDQKIFNTEQKLHTGGPLFPGPSFKLLGYGIGNYISENTKIKISNRKKLEISYDGDCDGKFKITHYTKNTSGEIFYKSSVSNLEFIMPIFYLYCKIILNYDYMYEKVQEITV